MAHDARPVYFTNGPNGEIPAVQLTGSNVAEMLDTVFRSNVDVVGTEVLFTTNERILLEDVRIGANDKRLILQVVPRNSSGSLADVRYCINHTGTASYPAPNYEHIRDYGHTLLDVPIFKEDTNEFLAVLKKAVEFPFGCLISVRNATSDDITAGAIINYRVLM